MKRNWARLLDGVSAWTLPGTSVALASIWGAGTADAAPAVPTAAGLPIQRREPITFTMPNRVEGPEIFVSHRSHSSHSSHSSHYSSSGSGGYVPYTPYVPSPAPAPATVAPPAPPKPVIPAVGPVAGSGIMGCPTSSVEGTVMNMRVQVELARLKLYSGKVDGKMGAGTVAGLRKFQAKEGLPATGVMDNATLAKLGVCH